MTYAEALTANPDLFEGTTYDEATQNSIYNVYQYMQVVDDDKFPTYFHNTLLMCERRYQQLYRIELTEFDPLVSRYLERQHKMLFENGATNDTTTTNSETGSTYGSSSGTSKDTTRTSYTETKVIDDVTTNQSTTTTAYGKVDTNVAQHTGTDTTTDEGTSTTDTNNREVSKTMPQSVTYSGTTANKIPSLDWQYPSSQAQGAADSTQTTENTNKITFKDTMTTTDTLSGSDKVTTSGSGTDAQTVKTTGSTSGSDSLTTSESTSGSSSRSGSGTQATTIHNAGNSMDREIYTGRENLTAAEALAKAIAYIKISNAFTWLLSQLDPCFMAIYDV